VKASHLQEAHAVDYGGASSHCMVGSIVSPSRMLHAVAIVVAIVVFVVVAIVVFVAVFVVVFVVMFVLLFV
jgi:hypothetical protein